MLQVLVDPSFGVLIAFLIFVTLTARMAWKRTRRMLSDYRSDIAKDIQDCEQMLKHSQEYMREALIFQRDTATKITETRSSVQEQEAHIRETLVRDLKEVEQQYKVLFKERKAHLLTEVEEAYKDHVIQSALKDVSSSLNASSITFSEKNWNQVIKKITKKLPFAQPQ
jgi:F0F1-type ATP synthase membrane subunit b/b'